MLAFGFLGVDEPREACGRRVMAEACDGKEVRRGHAVKAVNEEEEFGLNFNAFESGQVHFRV